MKDPMPPSPLSHSRNTALPLVGGKRLRWPRVALPISERRLLLGTVDLFFVNLALALVLRYCGQLQISLHDIWENLPWFLLLSAVWLAAAFLLDIYDLPRAASPVHSLWAGTGAVFATSVVYMLIPYVTPALPGRRLEILIFLLVAVTGVVVWRVIYATLLAQPNFQHTALIVGAGRSGRMLAQTLNETAGAAGNPLRGSGYRLLGYIDDDPQKCCQLFDQVPVLGSHADLLRLVRELEPNELILAITHLETIQPGLFHALLECRQLGVAITTMSSLYERATGRVPVDHAGHNLHIVLPLSHAGSYPLYLAAHRILDILSGCFGCIVFLLLSPAIWLANRLTSPGTLFYRQIRVGRFGNPFTLLKFRSMVMDAEKLSGAVWASDDDPRITPVGAFLRRTRLDEIPQCWNVLKGEMSLIGPRPERPELVESLSRHILYYPMRHAVTPGVTGWAQVKYGYGASLDDARIKLEYDLCYIKNQGVFLDFVITLKTVQVVLGRKGR